jgi:hypothetical protein
VKIRRRRVIVRNAVIAALLIAGCGAARKDNTLLRIRDAASGSVYARWPIQDGDTFTIEFVHSVHKTPVRETFAAAGGEIRPIASRFSSSGAGMDPDATTGRRVTRDGEFFVITGFTESYGELRYIVGTVYDHVFSMYNRKKKTYETISLRDLCGKNAHITITVGKTQKRGCYDN